MEVETDMKMITLVGEFKNNIEIVIENGILELKINQKTLFQTLRERKTIIGLMNKKLDGLVEEHISKLANKEQDLNIDL